MAGLTGEFRARLRGGDVDPQALGEWLDAATHDERLDVVRSLGKADQRRLYEAVEGFQPLHLVHLVPADVPAMTSVRHYGRNTLPAFRIFEKRFCRPEGVDPEAPASLYGYNVQSVSWVTGPGYFVAREDPERGEVCIDYRELPPRAAPGWPAIRSNELGLSRFVYGFMVDTLRRVSTHVTIGRAARNGKPMASWFALCREP